MTNTTHTITTADERAEMQYSKANKPNRHFCADGNCLNTNSPWLCAGGAADYIVKPLSRVRKLTMMSELPVHRDGRRVVYHRDELDDYLRSGGAYSP